MRAPLAYGTGFSWNECERNLQLVRLLAFHIQILAEAARNGVGDGRRNRRYDLGERFDGDSVGIGYLLL